jgi:hypothetical protein
MVAKEQVTFLDDGLLQVSHIYVKNLAHWMALAATVRAAAPARLIYVRDGSCVCGIQALAKRPSEVGGEALFVTNALDEQRVAYATLREGLFKRRRLPPPQQIVLSHYVCASAPLQPVLPFILPLAWAWPRRQPRAAIAFFLTVLEAVDWLTAGTIKHEVMQLNWNTDFFCRVDGSLDATRGARLLGYTPLYTLEQSLDDIASTALATAAA